MLIPGCGLVLNWWFLECFLHRYMRYRKSINSYPQPQPQPQYTKQKRVMYYGPKAKLVPTICPLHSLVCVTPYLYCHNEHIYV